RRAEVAAAGTVHAQLAAKIGTTSRVIGIGAPLEGTEQQWLVVGDRALLVDRWVARALDPDPLALRVRRPVEDAAQAKYVSVELVGQGGVAIEGTPKRETVPITLLPRAELIAALERA